MQTISKIYVCNLDLYFEKNKENYLFENSRQIFQIFYS